MQGPQADPQLLERVRRALDPRLRGDALLVALPEAVMTEVDPVLAVRADALNRRASAAVEEVTGEPLTPRPAPHPRWVRTVVMGVCLIGSFGGAGLMTRPGPGTAAVWAGLAALVVGLLGAAALSTPVMVRRRSLGAQHNHGPFQVSLLASLYTVLALSVGPTLDAVLTAVLIGAGAVAALSAVMAGYEWRRQHREKARRERFIREPARRQADELRLEAVEDRLESEHAHLLDQVPPERARQAVAVLVELIGEAQEDSRMTKEQARALLGSLDRRWPSATRKG